jgi:hypothetical protein
MNGLKDSVKPFNDLHVGFFELLINFNQIYRRLDLFRALILVIRIQQKSHIE